MMKTAESLLNWAKKPLDEAHQVRMKPNQIITNTMDISNVDDDPMFEDAIDIPEDNT